MKAFRCSCLLSLGLLLLSQNAFAGSDDEGSLWDLFWSRTSNTETTQTENNKNSRQGDEALKKAMSLLSQCQEEMNNGQLEQALGSCLEAKKLDPSNEEIATMIEKLDVKLVARTQFWQCQKQRLEGEFTQALNSCLEAKKLDPSNEEIATMIEIIRKEVPNNNPPKKAATASAPAKPKSGTPLSPNHVKSVLSNATASVSKCGTNGNLVVQFDITPAGKIANLTAVSGSFKGTPNEKCILSQAAKLNFNESPKGNQGVKWNFKL